MNDDFGANNSPRKKPKIIHPPEKPNGPSIHELAANEGHDINASDASGPEADEALAFAQDHTKSSAPKPDASITKNDASDEGKKALAAVGWKQKLSKKLSKKQWLIAAGVLAAVVIAGGTTLALTWPHQSPKIAVNAVPPPKPKIYSPLSGLLVSAAQAKLPVTGVMIENSLPARPQSGLSQAGVVYEAIAEAGITRFLALFQENQPSDIGPVRSARPYFVRWDLSYDANYAHVGGSPEGLSDIKSWGVRDLDQFNAGNFYHRISSRYAPHNMYTSMAGLRSLEKSRGYDKPSKFVGFSRKKSMPAKVPTASVINMNPSSPDYAVEYTYDKKTDAYKRFEGGVPHIDAGTNKQIEPKVVVALIVPYSLGSLDSSDAYYSVYNNVGSGSAYVFQDGKVTKCTWNKASNSASLKLLNTSGQPVKLNRGQTWITALGLTSELSYKP